MSVPPAGSDCVKNKVRTGSGSDRVETHAHSFRSLQLGQTLVVSDVVEHLENDPVATAPGSDLELLKLVVPIQTLPDSVEQKSHHMSATIHRVSCSC
jgi:hypothetical protein